MNLLNKLLFRVETTIGLFCGCVLAVQTARSEELLKYDAQPGSLVKIDGTSNIHDWTVKGQIMAGWMEVSPGFEKDFKTLAPAPKVEVTIPVRSLKSGIGTMDDVMQKHMNMGKHPSIKYRLTGLRLKAEPKASNASVEFMSSGELTICGVKKTIEMPVIFERLGQGKLKIKADLPLKMTDFGIEPPSPKISFGLIKTDDNVRISLEWVIAKGSQLAIPR